MAHVRLDNVLMPEARKLTWAPPAGKPLVLAGAVTGDPLFALIDRPEGQVAVLTVNLDNANDEWTLNGPGVMNLVNDNADETLLAGSDVNVNGTLNVTGDVRTTATLERGVNSVPPERAPLPRPLPA